MQRQIIGTREGRREGGRNEMSGKRMNEEEKRRRRRRRRGAAEGQSGVFLATTAARRGGLIVTAEWEAEERDGWARAAHQG